MELQFFWWNEVESLRRWAPGYAGALAYSKTQAIDLIVQTAYPDEAESLWGDELSTKRDQLKGELWGTEPHRIATSPFAIAIPGSE